MRREKVITKKQHKSDSPRKPAILGFKILFAGGPLQITLSLEQGSLNSQLLYDRHIIEVRCIFVMQKFDRVHDGTDVTGNSG